MAAAYVLYTGGRKLAGLAVGSIAGVVFAPVISGWWTGALAATATQALHRAGLVSADVVHAAQQQHAARRADTDVGQLLARAEATLEEHASRA